MESRWVQLQHIQGLHARWKAVVHEMSEGAPRRAQRDQDLERQTAPVPTPHPVKEDVHSKLQDALESVTVRSVVGLRGLTEVPADVEAVALAVLHLVSGEYLGQMGLGLEAPQTWEDARRVLLKPGHFVSSLRKFPVAMEQGQVAESSIIFAQQKFLELGEKKHIELAEIHEGASQLYRWLRAALQLAPPALIAAAASPARAQLAQPAQPATGEAYPRSAPSSPDNKMDLSEAKAPKTAPMRRFSLD